MVGKTPRGGRSAAATDRRSKPLTIGAVVAERLDAFFPDDKSAAKGACAD